MRPSALFALLQAEGVDFYAGVPDSLLKNFCCLVQQRLPATQHVITASEGGAVALAMGRYLAGAKLPVVYLQNSGLGNAINPLTSLADPLVLGVPMLLIVGWRGEVDAAGQQLADEPQHRRQGLISPALLQCLHIPHLVLAAGDPPEIVQPLLRQALERGGPVALLVRKDCFEEEVEPLATGRSYPLSRYQAISQVLSLLPSNTAYVATTGMIARQLYDLRQQRGEAHDADLLCVGAMGHAIQIAAGVAASYAGPVCCLDGDGALLMHTGNLALSSTHPRLLHVLLNNGVHASVGGQPTRGFDCDFCALALAAGYAQAWRVEHEWDLSLRLNRWLAGDAQGTTMIELRLNTLLENDLGRPKLSPQQNKELFRRFLQRASNNFLE